MLGDNDSLRGPLHEQTQTDLSFRSARVHFGIWSKSVYMRTGEVTLVQVWVRFGFSDRSENSCRPEILM